VEQGVSAEVFGRAGTEATTMDLHPSSVRVLCPFPAWLRGVVHRSLNAFSHRFIKLYLRLLPRDSERITVNAAAGFVLALPKLSLRSIRSPADLNEIRTLTSVIAVTKLALFSCLMLRLGALEIRGPLFCVQFLQFGRTGRKPRLLAYFEID